MTIIDIWNTAQKILKEARKTVNQGLKKYSLSSAEGNIILHLVVKGEGISQEDMIEDLEITKAAISRAVTSLVIKGYIKKERSLSDKRANVLTLTPKAKTISGEIVSLYNSIYEKAVKSITEDEVEVLADLFSKVSSSLGEDKQC